MHLIRAKTDNSWEIVWSNLPYYLALDKELMDSVHEEMNKAFVGCPVRRRHELAVHMHRYLVELILSRRDYPDLEPILRAYPEPDKEGNASSEER